MILYRPVGLRELELIAQLDFRAFPPRLPIQPIFYPVLNFDYAAHIAREWNTGDPVSGYAGFVTKWQLDPDYAARFEVQTVGARSHQELWVPAAQIDEFNAHIIGQIEIVVSFVGPKFEGAIDPQTHLPG